MLLSKGGREGEFTLMIHLSRGCFPRKCPEELPACSMALLAALQNILPCEISIKHKIPVRTVLGGVSVKWCIPGAAWLDPPPSCLPCSRTSWDYQAPLMMLFLSTVSGRTVSFCLAVPFSFDVFSLLLPPLLPPCAAILWWSSLIKDWRGFATCHFQRSRGRKL